MCVSGCEGVQGLRGERVKQRVDGICIGGLDSGIRLEAEPGGVFLIDVVIDSNCLYLFVINARMRKALTIGAAVSIIGNRGRSSTHIERTAKNCERRSAGISIERKHLLIEQDRLR